MEEIWKDVYFEENGIIYDYRGLYQVSNLDGKIKSLGNDKARKEKILKPVKTKDGYQNVILWKDGNKKFFLIHRLVAHMFIDGYFEGADVNHIDENKENNSVENLEWCTREYNINYGTHNERAGKTRSKKVIGYSLTYTKVIILQSMNQAKKFGFHNGAIRECCNGKRKSHKGYKWFYLDDIKNSKLKEE